MNAGDYVKVGRNATDLSLRPDGELAERPSGYRGSRGQVEWMGKYFGIVELANGERLWFMRDELEAGT